MKFNNKTCHDFYEHSYLAGNYRFCQTVLNNSFFNFVHISVANRNKKGKALVFYVSLDPHDFWL